jgi:alkanesulfonate monooxygenase SsuD/methylene tetrahydromethanopterin reductase-like flavin-dependent oxidoreductase (luciferase family)
MIVDPCGVQDHVPIWLGGRTPRSLRRALVLGDGWDPFGLGLEQLTTMIGAARGRRAWRELTRPFDLVLPIDRVLDPVDAGERRELTEHAMRYRDLGTTILNVRTRHRSLGHYLEQLEALAREVMPLLA